MVDKAAFEREVSEGIKPGASKAGEEAGKQLGDGMKKQVRSTVADLGAILASVGAGVFLKDAFKVDEAAIVSQTKLTAILKATGGEAGVTAEGVDALSSSLSKNAAIADETVKNAAAVLLTFRDVRNEAGKGNDVFDRTIKDATDLSAVFGGDLQSAVTTLGRALENPTAGMNTLTRSGLAFSAQVREQIKVLVQQGNLLGAQTLILDEVEKKFGGTAAAIAKADPFKRFSADLVVFKEQVGSDLLPVADEVTHVGESLFSVFDALPAPIRATAEGTVGLAIAGVGLSRMIGILGGLRGAFFGVAEGEAVAASGAVGFGSIIAGLIIGVGAGVAGGNKLNQILAGSQPNIDAYAKSLGEFGKSGGLGGVALDALGAHATKLSGDLATIKGDTIEKAFGFAPSAHRAVADIKSVNDALIELLAKQGAPAASKAFAALFNDLTANGSSVNAITSEFHPFLDELGKVDSQARAAATGVQAVTDRIKGLFDAGSKSSDLAGKLGVEDAFQSARDALDALNQARLDAAGKGTKSAAAADAEASAYHSLASAQQSARNSSQSLADAQSSLADAQAKLAEFDNPTSSTIRALERTQIVRRRVVTPADVRQKEIDLLNFDQSHADTRTNLLQSVAHAVEGVGKAEQGVADSTQKVADAQGKVSVATAARKKVQVDALNSIQGLERKAEEAALSAGATFANWADQAKPGEDVLKSMLTTLGDIAKAAGDPGLAASLGNIAKSIVTSAAGMGHLGGRIQHGGFGHGRPGGPDTGRTPADAVYIYSRLNPQLRAQIDANRAPLTQSDIIDIIESHVGPTDPRLGPAQVDFLHRLGVPGFALGGLANWPVGQPGLAVVHGGERVQTPAQQRDAAVTVNQTNNYNGGPPKPEDQQWNNIQLGWIIACRGGRA